MARADVVRLRPGRLRIGTFTDGPVARFDAATSHLCALAGQTEGGWQGIAFTTTGPRLIEQLERTVSDSLDEDTVFELRAWQVLADPEDPPAHGLEFRWVAGSPSAAVLVTITRSPAGAVEPPAPAGLEWGEPLEVFLRATQYLQHGGQQFEVIEVFEVDSQFGNVRPLDEVTVGRLSGS